MITYINLPVQLNATSKIRDVSELCMLQYQRTSLCICSRDNNGNECIKSAIYNESEKKIGPELWNKVHPWCIIPKKWTLRGHRSMSIGGLVMVNRPLLVTLISLIVMVYLNVITAYLMAHYPQGSTDLYIGTCLCSAHLAIMCSYTIYRYYKINYVYCVGNQVLIYYLFYFFWLEKIMHLNQLNTAS